MSQPNEPFITLGKHLKFVREQLRRSLAEVSGAVEIEELTLERIEAGLERPAEDILLLLISHLGVQDQEAVQLWELADYDGEVPEQIRPDPTNGLLSPGNKSIVMLMALDMRTVYSDGLDINYNQAGITLNFTQTSGQPQAMPVARIGMSYDQAARVLQNLQQALLKATYLRGPKALPPRSQSDASS